MRYWETNMSTKKKCRVMIQNAGLDLSEKDINDLVTKLDRDAQRARHFGDTRTFEEVAMERFEERISEKRKEVFVKKRRVQFKALAQKRAFDYIDRYREGVYEQTGQEANYYDAFKAYLVGTEDGMAFGSRQSVDARQKALEREFAGRFLNDLEKADLTEIAVRGDLDRDVAREMFGGLDESVTGNKQAFEYAKILRRSQDHILARMNRAGAWIDQDPSYIIRQQHDRQKMFKHGEQAWIDHIKGKLDWNRIAREQDLLPEEYDRFLSNVWKNLTIGKKFEGRSMAGSGNLAERVSAERILHFKDAYSFLDYHMGDQFGAQTTLSQTSTHAIYQAANNTGLMESFGTNPDDLFETIVGKIGNALRDDPTSARAFSRKRGQLDDYWNQITGKVNQTNNPTRAAIGSDIRALQSMSKLGGALLASFADFGTKASELNFQGMGLTQSWAKSLTGFTRNLGDGERDEALRLIGIGMDGILGRIHARFHGVDEVPGRMSRHLNTFFRLNGLQWWTEAQQAGTVKILSAHLGNHADKPMAELNQSMQRVMRMYGFDEAEWNLLRTQAVKTIDGQKYLVTDPLRKLSSQKIRTHLVEQRGLDPKEVSPAEIARYRDDLETRVRSYFEDSATHTIPEPSAKEQAWLTQGTDPGSIVGMAMRFITQFKAFPVSYTSKTLGRQIRGRGLQYGPKVWLQNGGASGVAHLIAASTVMGYLSMTAKDFVAGRTPRDLSKPETWQESLLRGGGLGIYGDFLFGQFNRYGSSPLEVLTGPTIGMGSQLLRAYGKVLEGDPEGGAELGFKTGVGMVPYGNMFYTKLAVDYLILNEINEMINPGYKTRMQLRAQDRGQDYWLPPN
ncbi:hypothetical protein V5T82_07300 [Magnetovibrio sp. PR-2]|uniref:hypothetical protein n=1 Tax=Magnetovibrio sp. PR-2 TaxID=3120356 RepID=UPI002FCE0511